MTFVRCAIANNSNLEKSKLVVAVDFAHCGKKFIDAGQFPAKTSDISIAGTDGPLLCQALSRTA